MGRRVVAATHDGPTEARLTRVSVDSDRGGVVAKKKPCVAGHTICQRRSRVWRRSSWKQKKMEAEAVLAKKLLEERMGRPRGGGREPAARVQQIEEHPLLSMSRCRPIQQDHIAKPFQVPNSNTHKHVLEFGTWKGLAMWSCVWHTICANCGTEIIFQEL